jgi:hypothetical protein
MHKSKRERVKEQLDAKMMLSYEEICQTIHDLVAKNERLEAKVRRLENRDATKRRKEVVEYLNHSVVPEMSFKEWTRGQTVNFRHLETVFETSLTDGIKMCIEEHLSSKSLPICAFEQRVNTFYIYDSSGSTSAESPPIWKRMENDVFERWVVVLSHRFMPCFIEWQMQNKDRINTEEEKLENIMRMMKVNGGRNPGSEKERRIQELKRWLFSKIQVSTSSLVEIVV